MNPAPIIMRGVGVGEGVVRGMARFVETASQLQTLKPGEIVLANEVAPDWAEHLAAAPCIITNTGDGSSHAAGIARKLGVLAVVGTIDGACQAWSGAPLIVSCSQGAGVVQEDLEDELYAQVHGRAGPMTAR